MKRISGHVAHKNGAHDFANVFSGMIADQLVEPASDEQLQKFKQNLVSKLSKLVEDGKDCIPLDCDYSPCSTLKGAAIDADIPLMNFPWKVSMRIHPDAVSVKDGYGQPWVDIWPIKH